MPLTTLSPDALKRRCATDQLGFASTRELTEIATGYGQTRAAEAIRFAIEIEQDGYNLFVLGPPGVGKRSLTERELTRAASGKRAPDDWCYVNNFADPQRPIALRLPRGRAAELRRDMAMWVQDLRSTLPAVFDSDDYRNRLERIEAEFNARQAAAFEALGRDAAQNGMALVRTPGGFSIAPLQGEEVMPPAVYEKLPEAERERYAALIERYQQSLEHLMHDLLRWRREAAEKTRALNREITELAVAGVSGENRAKYNDCPEVLAYLDTARNDVIEHADEFHKPQEPSPLALAGLAGLAAREPPDFRRYEVNVIVHHPENGGAPVVFEDNPLYQNLVGRVEHLAQLGALVTDFTLIAPGALHRANGGYLVVEALKVLTQPYAWAGLKRALAAHEIRIESLAQVYSLTSTRSLEPQPIPLDLKVVLLGTAEEFYLLQAYDPEFAGLFRIAAEFDEEVPWTREAETGIAHTLAAICERRKLRAFSGAATGAVIEYCARLASDADRLSVHTQSIEELAAEADHFARAAGRVADVADVEAADVQAAIDAQHRRRERIKLLSQEAIARDIIVVDTADSKIGQINGLSVLAIAKAAFAIPTRITATARLGSGQVLDIQREVRLGGPIHSKGVLTLSAFLADRYARTHPLSLAATLSLEQTYGLVEGDSASLAELCALLSALADAPIRQDLAVTGSINQRGEVQAIGGVNEKIEGFFDICEKRGLSGTQGVVIPRANRQHLMLRENVIDAVRAGRFHVHVVDTVDDAIERLCGMPAGARGANAAYPRGTLNGLVAARLAQFHAASAKPAAAHAVERPQLRGRRR